WRECGGRRRPGRALRLRDLPDVQPELPAPPLQVQRAAGPPASQRAQPSSLPGPDAAGARGNRRRRLRTLRARTSGRDRSPRARGGAHMSHEIVRTRGGALAMRSLADGEVMHPGVGPLVEAEQLYVRQSRLRERLLALDGAERDRLVLFDVGLGAGSNALAARAASEALPQTAACLELVSFERDLGAIKLALEAGEAFGWRGEAADAARALLAHDAHTTARTHWRLIRGDVLEWLARQTAR